MDRFETPAPGDGGDEGGDGGSEGGSGTEESS